MSGTTGESGDAGEPGAGGDTGAGGEPSAGGERGDGGANDPGSLDPHAVPDPSWDTVPADYVLGGVEILDPNGALDGLGVAVEWLDSFEGVPEGEIYVGGTFSMEPSGQLAASILVRFPLLEPLEPGAELELFSDHPLEDVAESADGWAHQSLGRVTASGTKGVFALDHLSRKAISRRNQNIAAFVAGKYCDGSTAAAAAYAIRQGSCGACARGDDPTATVSQELTHAQAMMPPLVDLTPISGIIFKNEECAPPRCTAVVTSCSQSAATCGDDEWGTVRLGFHLQALANAVTEKSCGALTLRLTEAFDSRKEHNAGSRHYAGRAADLTIVRSSNRALHRPAYGRLAQLAAEVGFDWSYYENAAHVHVSVEPDQNHTVWACSLYAEDTTCSCTKLTYSEGEMPPIAPGTPSECPSTLDCCYVGSDPNGCLCATGAICDLLPAGTELLERCPPPGG